MTPASTQGSSGFRDQVPILQSPRSSSDINGQRDPTVPHCYPVARSARSREDPGHINTKCFAEIGAVNSGRLGRYRASRSTEIKCTTSVRFVSVSLRLRISLHRIARLPAPITISTHAQHRMLAWHPHKHQLHPRCPRCQVRRAHLREDTNITKNAHTARIRSLRICPNLDH